MKNGTKPNSRRKFLLTAGLGSAGAAAAIVTGTKVAQQASPGAQAAGGKRGYHVSEHILKYYKTAQV